MKFACSQCIKTLTREEVFVVPWFNTSAADYLTTYRCRDCAPGSLNETRAIFQKQWQSKDEAGFERFVEFFRRHAVFAKEFELRELWFTSAARGIGLELLDSVARREIDLRP